MTFTNPIKTTSPRPKNMKTHAIICWLIAGLITIVTNSHAAVHDLKADWSDLQNPNGVWTYRHGTIGLPHVNAFQGLSGDFGSAQPAWARTATGNTNLPAWFKSSATVNIAHDWLTGDIIMHSTDGFNGVGSGDGNVIWTSPINGFATISGSVWMGRDIGRGNHWALFNDGILLTEGDIASGDIYNRNSPYHFSNGSGGAFVLQNIPVSIGEVFELRITKTSSFGDYAGVNFTVNTTPKPSAPVAQYHFDESSGPTAFDSTGAFNGTLSAAGATFSAGGISGNAISLDRAAGGFVNMGTSFPGFLTGDYSVVFWVKTTTAQIDTIAVSKHTASSANGFYFNINPTGDGGVATKVTFDASSQTSQGATSGTSVNDGMWHQVVGVYKAGGNEFIYVDGAPAEASSPSTAMISNAAPFLIGGVNSAGTPAGRFTGLIDEVQVYDYALTDAAISYLFDNPSQAIQTLGPLTLKRDGSGFRLTWPGNGILQSNDTLSGLWTDVNAGMATSPLLIPNPSDRDFFRLRN